MRKLLVLAVRRVLPFLYDNTDNVLKLAKQPLAMLIKAVFNAGFYRLEMKRDNSENIRSFYEKI